MSITFAELGHALCWRSADRILVVWVYYDESGEYDASGNLLAMSMGGCAASCEKWGDFSTRWNEALSAEGLSYFHMTDFEAWRPPFDFRLPDGNRDKDKHNRLLNSLLTLMAEHVEYFSGFADTRTSSEMGRAHNLAMETCVIAAVTHVVHDLWNHYQRPINLVFGKQRHFSYAKIMECVELYDFAEGRGRIGSVVVDEPQSLPHLQAADILAYEMSKVQRADRPERYPFIRLRDEARKRGIPMTLKWGPFTRISDFAGAGRRSS